MDTNCAEFQYLMAKVDEFAAANSDDHQTQTALLLVTMGDHGSEYIYGANHVPGVRPPAHDRIQRETKGIWMQHAEAAAIANAAKRGISTDGAVAFMRWFPCSTCAGAMVDAGIQALYCEEPNDWSDTKYHFEAARALLEENGVVITFMGKSKR